MSQWKTKRPNSEVRAELIALIGKREKFKTHATEPSYMVAIVGCGAVHQSKFRMWLDRGMIVKTDPHEYEVIPVEDAA